MSIFFIDSEKAGFDSKISTYGGQPWGKAVLNTNWTSVGTNVIASGSNCSSFSSFFLLGLKNSAISNGFAYSFGEGYQGFGSQKFNGGQYTIDVGAGGLTSGVFGYAGLKMEAYGTNLYRSAFANSSYRLNQGFSSTFGITGQRMFGGTLGMTGGLIGNFGGGVSSGTSSYINNK